MKIIKIKDSGKFDDLHIWFDRNSKQKTLTPKTAVNGASLDSLQIDYTKGSNFNITSADASLTCTVTDVETAGNNTIYVCTASPKV